ncbi:MAG: hypothetical protein EPN25_10290 [Nitrospirae bacterium]|nr:MAG: hypothetical protein EPN25_10290 [Nitrospirota bacterium]
MASPKKAAAKKPAAKKAAAKVTTKKKAVAKKAVAKKAVAKKAVAKKTAVVKPAIKKGSKLACQLCGFAITVDNTCGCMEEAHFICCETPMKLRKPAAKKK